ILPIHGMLDIETDYKSLTLREDRLFFLPPDCEHTFKANTNNEFLVLDISNNIVNYNDTLNLTGGKEILFDDKWKSIRALFLNEADNNKSSSSVMNLFFYCYDFIKEERVPDSIKYINKNFTEPISIKILADIEHYNVSYYTQWFKNQMNVSPMEYIQNLRVQKAKELLLDSELSILQISQMVGYEHHSSFTRAFKCVEQITPVDFRRNKK
ncbi:AraC family transcriptional regulator, partial [Aminipila sp.]|uniref:AraC family transcriptional regulator n=1 Tax=Aminipila sp. TaxID=2060095 RepID=UPI00289ED9DD